MAAALFAQTMEAAGAAMRDGGDRPGTSAWLRQRVAELEGDLARLRAGASPAPDLGVLSEAEGVYAGVIEDASNDANPDYRYVTANAATQAFFASSITGRRASALGFPVSVIRFCTDMIARCAETGRAQAAEYAFPVRGHEDRWYLGTYAPMAPSPTGQARASFIVTDITARRLMEGARVESEARFRALAEAVPGLVFESQGTANDYANARYLTYTGLPAEALRGDGWHRCVHPDDLAMAARVWEQSVARGSPYECEFRIRRHDGAHRWFLFRGLPSRNAAGAIVRWLGIGIDIHDRKQSEAQLRRFATEMEQLVAERAAALADSEARFRAYFEAVEDILFTIAVSPDGVFRHEGFNPHGERRTGLANPAVRGRTTAEVLAPDTAAAMEQGWTEACRSLRSHRTLHRLVFPGGEGVFDTLVAPIADAGGRVVRLIGAAREVTDQIRLEEQLRQTQKMQAIGQLTGGVAHDFNNLLTGVMGSLELLGREVTSERGLRLIAAAQRGAARGATLTAQLLAFSRRQRLEPRVIDINGLLTGMAELLATTLGATIRVETRLAAGLWPALADATQFELAVLNLAINARDAMPGGGAIDIATGNVTTPAPDSGEAPPEGDFICVWVTDTGIGMTADVVARAFEPFFTTKDVGRGSGLGLPQVLGVAKQLGGGIRLDSQLGQGTTVRMFLPRAAAA